VVGDLIRVLIAEPDRALGDLYRTALQQEGWAIELVPDAASVWSRIRATRPDVLVVNSLPDADVFTVVDKVRSQSENQDMVIVVMLDSVDRLDSQRAKKLNVQAWLSKTRITREKLSETITNLVNSRIQTGDDRDRT
jgi:DNA-binding response OmpR family regulator